MHYFCCSLTLVVNICFNVCLASGLYCALSTLCPHELEISIGFMLHVVVRGVECHSSFPRLGRCCVLAMAEDQKWKPTTNAKYGIGECGTSIHMTFTYTCM